MPFLTFPCLTRSFRLFDYDIPYTVEHKAFYLENQTNLLTSYPGVKGVKTGYTPEAGLCLVTYLDYGGHKIIAVILGSDDRRGEMIELLDYSLKVGRHYSSAAWIVVGERGLSLCFVSGLLFELASRPL